MSNKIMAATILAILTTATAIVVILGASEEPYLTFRTSQALVQVGAGTALLVLWVQIGCWIIWRVVRRAFSRVWLFGALSAAVAIFYLQQSPLGYVEDLQKFEVCRQR